MEIEFKDREIICNKNFLNLDKFTFDFCSVLNQTKINYVIISGYIPVFFGRNRTSEDIDMFIDKIPLEEFKEIWEKLKTNNFECINTKDYEKAYSSYLCNGDSIRFALKNTFIPNIEIKFRKKILDKKAMDEKIKIISNDKITYFGPLELQIVYKLFLDSEKDIEDARFLFKLFKNKLKKEEIKKISNYLNVKNKLHSIGWEE
ncbi:hypothetical protein KO317_02740 [Candidatus Micrarchaeota archaeon]|jgi:hypothetical protein|nr:hypothetical protein [Candidatus Micrarchaeota archaeon]